MANEVTTAPQTAAAPAATMAEKPLQYLDKAVNAIFHTDGTYEGGTAGTGYLPSSVSGTPPGTVPSTGTVPGTTPGTGTTPSP